MISFRNRSTGIEIMDDLDCKGEVVDQTLRELDFINQWLGGNAVTLNGLQLLWKSRSKSSTITIADLGCGSGEMVKLIAQLARKSKRSVSLTGIDANTNIIEYAKKNQVNDSIKFLSVNIFSDSFKVRKFDILVCTLFLHHFSDEELVVLFRSFKQQASIGIVVNDIHRHPFAYYSIKWLTQLFSNSAMVKFDAPLSVRRAFTNSELKSILSKAEINNYQLKWKWAFRWQLIIYT